jgi:hypothetical protein
VRALAFPSLRPRAGRVLAALALAATALAGSPARAAEQAPRVRFIAIYDSHGLTPFGDRLDAFLLAYPAAELTSYTLGGASPSWLQSGRISPRGYVFDSTEGKPLLPRSKLTKRDARTPVLEELLHVTEGAYDRQVVILTLGSNVPGAPGVQTAPVESIVRSVNTRADALCIWVGPPSIRSWSPGYSDKVYEAIREGILAAEAGKPRRTPACHLIDSRKFSAYPAGGDGMHYGFVPSGIAAANRWADGVASEIEGILRAPP